MWLSIAESGVYARHRNKSERRGKRKGINETRRADTENANGGLPMILIYANCDEMTRGYFIAWRYTLVAG